MAEATAAPATIDDATAVRVFRALGDCTRFKVVRLLIERGELGVSDLQAAFPLSAPCLSHHTRILQECGLIGLRKAGAFHFFHPRREMIAVYSPGLLAMGSSAALADCDD
jgi:ArsR family transcriptional regulator, arsenate/arsenite/antimonite-responsive transcriptional repressor